ncbi:MAG TPA: ribonuclease P protein component [Pseudogracilibacillus sp.]|nr:ribonuclease P protein component [Pseudogracilibacillus sp.]
MKKIYRVKKQDDFQYILRKGNSFANRELVLYYLKNPEQKHFRIGISVGKKIGNAVVRNQIKRYIRQAIHELEETIDPRIDFIIIARMPTKNMSFFQIKKSISHLLYKQRLFIKKTK